MVNETTESGSVNNPSVEGESIVRCDVLIGVFKRERFSLSGFKGYN